ATMASAGAPRIPTPAAAAPAPGTTTTTASTAPKPTNFTTIDVRNQQTLDAVAANHAPGSTSSLGPLAGSPTVSGFTLGETSGSTPGTTTGAGTGATGTGTTATTPSGAIAVPVFSSPSDMTSGGTIVSTSTTAPVVASNAVIASDVYGTPVLSASVVTPDQAANDAAVNRALRQVARDRARVGRNGQLLYSIAPRTNVDRSNEMPDDGPSPSLSGYYSALTR